MTFFSKISGINLYRNDTYINKDRWVSYFWQTRLIRNLIKKGEVLEVGVGNKIVADFLWTTYKVTTVDIDSNLNPEHVGSVENLNFLPSNKFDVVLCAEVLEHLPFEKFATSLSELKRVSKKYIVISLPYWGYTFGCKIKLPLLGTRAIKFKISGLKPHRFNNSQHYWEIGKRGYPLVKIKHAMEAAGLKLRKSFWDIDDPYHYYFVLEK